MCSAIMYPILALRGGEINVTHVASVTRTLHLPSSTQSLQGVCRRAHSIAPGPSRLKRSFLSVLVGTLVVVVATFEHSP